MRFDYFLEKLLPKETAAPIAVEFRRIRSRLTLEVELSAFRRRLYLALACA